MSAKVPSPPCFHALISDIHGNIDALTAVLADIGQYPCRGIICLGDIVGYGPEPAACVKEVMNRCQQTVQGNHEAMLLMASQFPSWNLGDAIAVPIELARLELSSAQMQWLHALPAVAGLENMTFSHASLSELARFNYIHEPEDAREHFVLQKSFVSFQGHTHVPALWQEKQGEILCYSPGTTAIKLDPGCRYAVNVGSVGQPRDEIPDACYALYDFERNLLLYRRVAYDIPKAQARFRRANLPEVNARRIKLGQ